MYSTAKKSESRSVSRSAANVHRSKQNQLGSKATGSPGAHFVQPKLILGSPGGKFEKEADSAADRVTGISPTGSAAPVVSPISQMSGPSPVSKKSEVEEEEVVQTKQESNGSEHKMSGGGDSELPPDFGDRLSAAQGSGESLDTETHNSMESAFNADFSSVNIHAGPDAAEMSRSINARAFTHGSDIYFNDGEYQPETDEGRHLLAHELTHTIQQGESGQTNGSGGTVQRSLFSRGWRAIRRAGEWVGDSLQAGKDWLLRRITGMVRDIPGYRLFTVVLGRDPITRQSVARNGRNFIEAGLDVIPFGNEFKRKLEQEGALGEAAAWLDEQIALLDISPTEIVQQVRNLWNSLSLSDVRDPGAVFDRLFAIFTGPVNRIIRFARNVAAKFLEIVKKYLLSKLRDFVTNRESPSFYPLLTVVLGYDPITGEDVDRSGANILRGFISLHPEGDEQLRQMQETGSFQRAAEWIDLAIVRVRAIASGLRMAFITAWHAVTDIRSLMDPVGTFTRIYQGFRTPLVELVSFAWEVASTILKFIKDALLRRLAAWARETRGYPLITVLLGKDPFTEEVVPRSPENIIRGFMALLPNGLEKFNRLQESGAIARMVSWIEGAVASLNITWSYIVGLFTTLWESLSLRDLVQPIAAFQRIINTFADPIRRIFAFIFEVIKAVVMFVLEVMNFPFETIQNIVNNAMQAYDDIRRDPIEFFLNLLRAVKQGFTQFFANILDHLLGGLRTWLFGELSSAGITPPADLSFRSILGFIMELLGITVNNIWERLALKIGPERVEQIRSAIDRVTGIWNFVKDVYERGPVAIWEYIQERLSNLWDMVLGQIREWIMTRIIHAVTARLLSMLDPTGIMAVVNSFIAFYRAIQSFMERLREMLEIVNTFVAGVANIARGTISQAANYLEDALAQGIPVAIGFLANQVGLRGLGSRIAEMVESLRERVNAAIDWLIDRALAAGSALMEMGRSAVGAIRNWWQSRVAFRAPDGQEHAIYFTGESESARLMIASREKRFESFINGIETEENPEKEQAKQQALDKARELDAEKRERIDPNLSDEQQQAAEEEKANKIDKLLAELRDYTIVLFGSDVPGEPADRSFDGTDTAGFGKSMHITKLHATNKPTDGSRPTSSAHDVYDLLNLRRKSGGSSYYVRGHLLNEHLGGPGQWENMVPLSRSGNAQHERDVESKVKTAFDSGAIIEYNVRPSGNKYSGGAQSLKNQIESLENNPENIPIKKRIVDAESHVPQLLITEAYALSKTGDGAYEQQHTIVKTNVDNPVERTAASYYIDGSPAQPMVYLNFENDIGKIRQATGLSVEQVRQMLSIRESRGQKFGRYVTFLRAAGLNKDDIPNKADELSSNNRISLALTLS